MAQTLGTLIATSMKNIKWLILLAMIISAPVGYAYFMVAWTYVSLPFVEYFEPSTGNMAGVLLILANTVGIVVLGFLLATPLNYLFRVKGYLVAMLLSIVIVGWSIFVWVSIALEMPNYITIIEWLAVIIVLPVAAVITYNNSSGGVNEQRA